MHQTEVSWDLVTRLELDHVTNDELPDGDSLHLVVLAAEDWKVLFTVEGLEVDELGVLGVIVPSSDKDLDEECNNDEDTLDPADSRVHDHAWDNGDDGKNGYNEHDTVVE